LRVLVLGLIPYDAGKTEFVIGLAEALEDIGFNPGYFKPVAGHDGWYQYDTILYSMEAKVLIGHDAYVVSEKLGLLDKLNLVSPLDILTLPVDLAKLGLNVHAYNEYMSYIGRRAVLMRFTRFIDMKRGDYRDIYFIGSDALAKISDELKEVLEALMKEIKHERSLFVEVTTKHIEKILGGPEIYRVIDSYINYLGDRDPLIIEGYNDVAAPTMGSLYSDYVFVVSPGKALVYSGERYRTAVNLLSYRGNPWTITSSSVVEVLGNPLASFDIPLKIAGEKYSKTFHRIAEFIS